MTNRWSSQFLSSAIEASLTKAAAVPTALDFSVRGAHARSVGTDRGEGEGGEAGSGLGRGEGSVEALVQGAQYLCRDGRGSGHPSLVALVFRRVGQQLVNGHIAP